MTPLRGHMANLHGKNCAAGKKFVGDSPEGALKTKHLAFGRVFALDAAAMQLRPQARVPANGVLPSADGPLASNRGPAARHGSNYAGDAFSGYACSECGAPMLQWEWEHQLALASLCKLWLPVERTAQCSGCGAYEAPKVDLYA